MIPALLGIAAFGVVCVLYGALIERNWFALRTHRVPCLPPGSPRVTILHVSDLHFRRGQRRKAAFLARCGDVKPDVVVCTGDFLDAHAGLDVAVDAVHALKPSSAALYVLGAHDYYASTPSNPFRYFMGPSNRRPPKGQPLPWRDLVEKLAQEGWRLLRNEAAQVSMDGLGSVDVVGLDDPHLHREDLSVASPRTNEGFRLGIVHSPDAAGALVSLGYDLVLSGHTHGGQVRVPGIGALVTNTKNIDRRMARGLHRLDGAWLHVSAGLGTSGYTPFRFACRPEVCVLELVGRDSVDG